MTRYAQVVLGLPLDGPFDYSIPEGMPAAPGCRVWVDFRGLKSPAYIVGISDQPAFPRTKPLLSLIDREPVLPPFLLPVTRRLSGRYCCSWGEMIDTALPGRLRKGGKVTLGASHKITRPCAPPVILIHAADNSARWRRYLSLAAETLRGGKNVIILVADTGAIPQALSLVKQEVPECRPGVLFRQQPGETKEWEKAVNGEYNLVIGTRSAVFAPLTGVGLIIVEDEHDHAYKQDQVPHYHARAAALERGREEGARVIFGSPAPSLEMMLMARNNEASYERIGPGHTPEVTVVDTTRLPYRPKSRIYVSTPAEEAILSALSGGRKVLVFINRRGFATAAVCSTCGSVMKCPRCGTNLVYYFRDRGLSCNYCAFNSALPGICPECNSGYIKLHGAGTEKVESELARIFPSARLAVISRESEPDLDSADIFVATQSVLSHPKYRFDVTAVLYLDNSLNHPDFRATEKAYALLTGLAGLTASRLILQTKVPDHYAVRSVAAADPDKFYYRELDLRAQLSFPPFSHFALVKCRGKDEAKTAAAARAAFSALEGAGSEDFSTVSLNPGQPPRLRDFYYWNVLLKGPDPVKISAAIKIALKDFRRSGIIVTVDVDPV